MKIKQSKELRIRFINNRIKDLSKQRLTPRRKYAILKGLVLERAKAMAQVE